ncbi:putative nucleotidyltransferase substrate binding domain protein [compost metagenome]
MAPPLGLLRDFSTEEYHGQGGYIDLKKSAARLFVDAARVLALAKGIAASSTIKRLERAAKQTGSAPEETAAIIDAFNFIQMLRLRHQHLEDEHGRPGDNLIQPDKLNPLDRRILKESFRQARKLQQKLKVMYQL